MPPPYHHGDLRRALLEEALRVVEAESYDALSLRACARAVGVDVAACYRHYRNKEAVLTAVAALGFAELGAALDAALAVELNQPQPDPRAGLTSLGRAYAAFGLARPQLYRLMFNGPCRGDALKAALAALPLEAPPVDAYDVLTRSLDALAEAGEILPHTRPGAELVAWSALHGLTSMLIDGRGPEDRGGQEALVERACRMVRLGLAAGA